VNAEVFSQNVYSLRGNYFYRRKILKGIKEHFKSYEISVCDEESSFKYVEHIIFQDSCFSEGRLVILNDWPSTLSKTKKDSRTKVLKQMKELVQNVPEDCILVLNNLETTSKSFFSLIKKNGKIFEESQFISKKGAKDKILKYFMAYKKTIQDEDIEMIVNSMGITSTTVNLDNLLLLVRKIHDYVGDQKNIKTEDVMKICVQSEDFIIWSLYKAFDNKNVCMALYLLKMSLASAKDQQGQISEMLYSMKWRYKLLLFVKECQKNKLEKDDVWKKLSTLTKLKRSGSDYKIIMEEKKEGNKENIVYSKKMFETLYNNYSNSRTTGDCYTSNELLFINFVISQVIVKTRTTSYARSGFDDNEGLFIMEVLCLVICRAIKRMSSIGFLRNKDLLKAI